MLTRHIFVLLIIVTSTRTEATDNNIMWQFDFSRAEYSSDLECIGVLQHFRFFDLPESEFADVFQKLESADKKIMPYLGNNIVQASSSCVLDDVATGIVSKYANNDLVYGWHIVDEPEGDNMSGACQLQLYDEVKKIDPNTPVVVSTNTSRSSGFRGHLNVDAFDILTFHRYVNPSIDRAQIRQQQEIEKLELADKKLVVTLRAFNSPKVRRVDMMAQDMDDQLRHYLTTQPTVDGFGFYGWKLAPNTGISQNETLADGYKAAVTELDRLDWCG